MHADLTRGIVLSLLLAAGCGGARPNSQGWVDELTLRGAEELDADDIEEGLATRETSWWWWLPLWGERRPFQPGALDLDVRRIESYYGWRAPTCRSTPRCAPTIRLA